MVENIIKTELPDAIITYENDILTCKFRASSKINEENAKRIVNKVVELTNKKDYLLIIDASEMMFISNEARQYFGKRNNPHTKSVAIIVKSGIQKSFANLYLKFSKPQRPTKMFTDQKKATDWLKIQVK